MLGADRAAARRASPPLPQVDLVSSVPTRAADAMFWLGRAAERAEAIARTARVDRLAAPDRPVAGHVRRRSLGAAHGATCCASSEAPALATVTAPRPRRPIVRARRAELAAATAGRRRAARRRCSPRRRRSASTCRRRPGRVLRSMAAPARRRSPTGVAPIDALDACIADLAAFVGLWNESTVRGPAWRFGDLGRRIERALVVLGLVDAGLRRIGGGRDRRHGQLEAGDVVDRAALEVLLAANESLVAYRRHHRSDVELGAGDRPAARRPRQPALVPRLPSAASPSTWRRSTGRRGAGPWPRWPGSSTPTPTCSAAVGRRRRAPRVEAVRRRSSSRRGSPRRSTRWSSAAESGDGADGPPRRSATAPSHRTTYEYGLPMADGYTRRLPAAATDGAAGRRGGRGDDRSGARRARRAHRRVRQPGAAARRPPRPRHADAPRRERGRRARPARPSPRRAVGGRRHRASRDLRGGDALAVRPFAGSSPYVPLDRARRGAAGDRRGGVHAPPPDRRRGPRRCATSIHERVRVRPVVHRRVDAAVGRARPAPRRVPGLRPPRRRAACARSASPPATSAATSRPTRRPAGPASSAPTPRTPGARCGCRSTAGSTSTRRTTTCRRTATSPSPGAATTATSRRSAASSSAPRRRSSCMSPSTSCGSACPSVDSVRPVLRCGQPSSKTGCPRVHVGLLRRPRAGHGVELGTGAGYSPGPGSDPARMAL